MIDEFPYLARANPELPSLIQEAFRPMRDQRTTSRTRLLLCGSALSFMGRLLSGNAPLRGRAGLELLVRPLDHRLAAEFWEISDPALALKVNAVVGGTPAYRREFARGDTPVGPEDFDDWVVRTVLNPETPLFREARYLLAEEPDLRDSALYLSVLAAVADGNATRGGMAGASRRRFVSNVLGPHFEQICREWSLHHADPDLFGGLPARVGHGVVHDSKARTGHKVDVAVIGIADGGKPPLLAIGEAKWNDTMGIAHVERLRHIRDLIAASGRYDTTRTRLVCFSGAGFNDKAAAQASASSDVHLIDLPALYGRS
ncbi:AAA family ATPase [Microbispora bryophytorum]|uniref:AAA family ATPase n=1 Tax=Microbispora bryophytorum TaxID=1460882 RepID=UPI001CC2C4B3|nr:hypothetical protein [Microbispora camponoti]